MNHIFNRRTFRRDISAYRRLKNKSFSLRVCTETEKLVFRSEKVFSLFEEGKLQLTEKDYPAFAEYINTFSFHQSERDKYLDLLQAKASFDVRQHINDASRTFWQRLFGYSGKNTLSARKIKSDIKKYERLAHKLGKNYCRYQYLIPDIEDIKNKGNKYLVEYLSDKLVVKPKDRLLFINYINSIFEPYDKLANQAKEKLKSQIHEDENQPHVVEIRQQKSSEKTKNNIFNAVKSYLIKFSQSVINIFKKSNRVNSTKRNNYIAYSLNKKSWSRFGATAASVVLFVGGMLAIKSSAGNSKKVHTKPTIQTVQKSQAIKKMTVVTSPAFAYSLKDSLDKKQADVFIPKPVVTVQTPKKVAPKPVVTVQTPKKVAPKPVVTVQTPKKVVQSAVKQKENVKKYQQTTTVKTSNNTNEQVWRNYYDSTIDILAPNVNINKADLYSKIDNQVKKGIIKLPDGITKEKVALNYVLFKAYGINSVIAQALNSNVKLTDKQQKTFEKDAGLKQLDIKQMAQNKYGKLSTYSSYDHASKKLQKKYITNLKQLRQMKKLNSHNR